MQENIALSYKQHGRKLKLSYEYVHKILGKKGFLPFNEKRASAVATTHIYSGKKLRITLFLKRAFDILPVQS